MFGCATVVIRRWTASCSGTRGLSTRSDTTISTAFPASSLLFFFLTSPALLRATTITKDSTLTSWSLLPTPQLPTHKRSYTYTQHTQKYTDVLHKYTTPRNSPLTHVLTNAHTHTCTHDTLTCERAHTHVHIHTYAHTHVHMHTQHREADVLHKYTTSRPHPPPHTHTYSHMHTRHAHMRAWTHTCTHTSTTSFTLQHAYTSTCTRNLCDA